MNIPFAQVNRTELTGGGTFHDGLPSLPPDLVPVQNGLFRRGGAISVRIGAEDFSIAVEPWRNPPVGATCMTLMASAPLAEVYFPDVLVRERLSGMVVPGKSVSEEGRVLLTELAIADLIETVEAALGEQIRLVYGAATEDMPVRAILRVSPALGSAFDLHAKLSPYAARRLEAAMSDGVEAEKPRMAMLPFLVSLYCGTTVLTMPELRSLRPGDIVLVEDQPISGAVAVFAGHHISPARRQPDAVVVTANPRKIAGSDLIWASADNIERNNTMTTSTPDVGSLEDIPVRVHFEIGRQEMAFHEIRNLTAGSVLPVAPLADEAVNIVANGRIIGRGTVTRLGEGLGVVITRLSGDE